MKRVKNDFEYLSPVPEDKYNDVILHLRNNFFHDEPLNKSVELCKKGEPNKELEEHSLDALKDQYSIAAYDCTTKQITGVILNKIIHKGDFEKDIEKIKSIPNAKYKKIFNFMYTANSSIDIFSKFNVDILLEHRILSVDNAFRNKGIGGELVRLSEELARRNKIKVVKTDATNIFSQKIFQKLGFEQLFCVPYKDYKTDGEIVFKIPEPHKTFAIMAKYLDN